MKYNLPKGYLSYSAIDTWMRSKDVYRKRYYEKSEPFETVETIFGHAVHKNLENGDKNGEFEIQVDINGVLIKGRIDWYDPQTHSFKEYKTGHADRSGKSPWDKVRVARHLQLPFYSLLIEEFTGKVDKACHLIWLESRFKKKTVEFDGHTLHNDSRELELTGNVKVFKRIIYKWERERVRKLIGKVAKEIHEDYIAYLKTI